LNRGNGAEVWQKDEDRKIGGREKNGNGPELLAEKWEQKDGERR
jgi:hypothetical protein